MTQYNITGMSCAACSARIEKAVSTIDGVKSCSVSLLTNSMGVEGDVPPDTIINAVTKAGYGASLKNGDNKASIPKSSELENTELKSTRNRLISSLVFLLPLMYISMGHAMWGWPLPSFFTDNSVAIGLAEMILAAIVMVINQKFFINGFKGIINRSPNMDTLVAMGAGASFIYSVYIVFKMTLPEHSGMAHMAHELYFESAAMILTLITVGKMLEAYSKGRTTDALKGLMDLAPKTATVLKNGKEETVPIEAVKKDDIFIVKPGDSVPVDGVIIEGSGVINESALTGESIPVDKAEGDNVCAATINQSGYIKCQATRVGEDTTLSQIIKMVSDAAATKAPIAKIADKVSGVFVPTVIGIALVAFFVWLFTGHEFGYALSRGISVLVISCPCALGLATPVAVMVGNGIGAKNGILFKTAASLEETGRIQIAALDKTGTITQGTPKITDIIPFNTSENQLLSMAYSIECKSEHPLARAIVDYADEKDIDKFDVDNFKVLSGNGLKAEHNKKTLVGGNLKYISSQTELDEELKEKASELSLQGKTPMFFAYGGKPLGIIAVADTIKADSPEAIRQLKNMGIKVVMLTGDNAKTANAIGKQAGVDMVIADVLPDGKESVVRKLKEQGKVAMVGDGINDAPALTRADVGIAVNAGTDIAIDAADVVLMNSKLSDVAAAIRLSRRTLINIKENLFWAFIYNIIGIPLAAGLWIPINGMTLSPMFGAAAMSLSSFCVVSNALRLNLINIQSTKRDKKIKSVNIEIKEENTMKKTFNVDGMMCPHCEATVKKAVEALPQVESATASHENKTVEVELNAPVDDSAIINAITEAGYTVL